MRTKIIVIGMTFVAIFALSSPSHAIGKYKWFDTSATGHWFDNGIICYKKDSETKAGMKFSYEYRLGQSKKFFQLGKGVSISGETLVDSTGEIPAADSEGSDDLGTVCDDGAASIAYVAPSTPELGGAYTIRLTTYQASGKVAWIDDRIEVLAVFNGAEYGTNFFTNPPKIYFSDFTYANISPSFGVKSYTSKGTPRNACLLVYDVAIKSASNATALETSITSQKLIQSAQGGGFGNSIRNILGAAAIPTAIKCAPWVATYLW